jgi:hypothetical protein
MLLLELFALDSEIKVIHVSCYQKCTFYLINVTIEHILSPENGMYCNQTLPTVAISPIP